MTIKEAIEHCEGRALADCSECATEHRQLAEWLTELKECRWIPVSERLPDEPEENPVFDNKQLELYLVSVKNTDYAFRAFWNGISFTDGWSKLDVVAWMPVPEPYRPEPRKE